MEHGTLVQRLAQQPGVTIRSSIESIAAIGVFPPERVRNDVNSGIWTLLPKDHQVSQLPCLRGICLSACLFMYRVCYVPMCIVRLSV